MNERASCLRNARSVIIWAAIGVLLIGVSATEMQPKKLFWNASASMPVGLYRITNDHPEHGDLVLAKLPDWAKLIADQRGYLPSNVPALKRVIALSGDQVCRFDRTILVNGMATVWARKTDRFALRLPVWNGCVTLDESQIFLLADHPKSFDGRYFGVTKLADVLGVAKPVWIGSE